MPSKTVLVVEDDPIARTIAVETLEDAGHDVVAMDNADDALGYVLERCTTVAAIFTDIQMPGNSNGLHLAELAGRHWPHIMVLMSSGRTYPASTLPRNVRFIPKPWRMHDVVKALSGVLTG